VARRWGSSASCKDGLELMRPGEAKRQEKERPVPCSSILILGVGNILLSDEGVGVRVIEAMREMKLPNNVELLDGGTASLDLLESLANRDKVIVVDAVIAGNEVGTLYRFTPGDITIQGQNPVSVHEIGLLETLTIAGYLGCAPREVIIYGIEPKETGLGLELSSEVAGIVPKVVELVLGEVGSKHT